MKRFLLLVAALTYMALAACAQTFRFVRADAAAGVDTSKLYVVASAEAAPRFFLTCLGVKDNAKLAAAEADVSADTVTTSNLSLLWKFSLRDGRYCLASVQSGKYVAPGKKPADLAMSASAAGWVLATHGDAVSLSADVGGSTRYVACDKDYGYFGCFTDRDLYGDLVLYERVMPADNGDTPDAVPDSTYEYCLLASTGDKTYAASSRMTDDSYLGFSDVSLCALADGRYSMWNARLRWTLERSADGSFRLRTSVGAYLNAANDGGTCVRVNAVSGEASATFRTSGGHIVGTMPDGRTLSLALKIDAAHGGAYFCFAREADIDNVTLFPVSLGTLATVGTSTTDARGLKTLAGGYDTEMLAKAIDAATTSLDLRGITLPRRLRKFDYDAPTNCIIYVRAASLAAIPPEWNNVVACNDDGTARLTRVMRLADAQLFHAAYPFAVGNDSLLYTRALARTGWSTLCLPFAVAAADADVGAYSADRVSGETIEVTPCDAVEAARPYLVRFKTEGEGSAAVTFTAAAGVVSATTDEPAPCGMMQGTFARRDVVAASEGVYLLSQGGYRFVRAAAGSYLNPFRCLLVPGAAAAKSIAIGGGALTGADAPFGETHLPQRASAGRVFTTDGACTGTAGTDGIDALPLARGVYILNGKKILINRK